MKKALLITLFTLLSAVCFGQNGGPLKFLGIPIDGSEAQFDAKLKSKGFTYNPITESYKGQFNGSSVNVIIHTNHNLVDRVYVAFPDQTEENIRIEFNRLLAQFKNNDKYMDLCMNEEISDDDDISYEMIVNKKRYQATFNYFDFDRDPIAFMDALLDKFSEFYTAEQLSKLKAIIKKAVEAPEDQMEALKAEMLAEMQKMGLEQNENAEPDPDKAVKFLITYFEGLRSLADGEVWFMIHESYGQYQIGLYYDNLHNKAHGEDL